MSSNQLFRRVACRFKMSGAESDGRESAGGGAATGPGFSEAQRGAAGRDCWRGAAATGPSADGAGRECSDDREPGAGCLGLGAPGGRQRNTR